MMCSPILFLRGHTMNNTNKFDIYQNITDRIIEMLEKGTAPWIKPWNNPEYNFSLPKNAVSNRYYSGINILLLWMAMDEKGYTQSKWVTAKNANDLGGYVRKGEKSTLIALYSPITREKLDDNGEPILDENGQPELENFAILKKHHVFNIEQCEGLPKILFEPIQKESEEVPFRELEDIKNIHQGMNLTVISKKTDKAFYRPKTDVVTMPEMKQFHSEADYYSTLLHEMTHATGHQKRLCREGITSVKSRFGNKIYAFEELVAEIGGAFLCAHIGFDTVPQNASYIASWIDVLKSDKKAIFRATGKAREACEYMLDTLNVMRQATLHEEFVA